MAESLKADIEAQLKAMLQLGPEAGQAAPKQDSPQTKQKKKQRTRRKKTFPEDDQDPNESVNLSSAVNLGTRSPGSSPLGSPLQKTPRPKNGAKKQTPQSMDSTVSNITDSSISSLAGTPDSRDESQNSGNSATPSKKQNLTTKRGSSELKVDKLIPGLSQKVADELADSGIFPLKKKSTRFPRANYFCRVCEFHCDTVPDCRDHMKDRRHSRRLEVSKGDKQLKDIPAPSPAHIEALTKAVNDLLEEHGLSEDDMAKRKQVVVELEETLSPVIPGLNLKLYGSSVTGFGMKSSDANVDIILPRGSSPSQALVNIYKTLTENESYKNTTSDFRAKIPSVGFFDSQSNTLYQLTVGNSQAQETTELLSLYNKVDPRVRKLAVAFRYWAKVCKVDQQMLGTMPGYVTTLLTIYFLQQLEEPILPVLHEYSDPPEKTQIGKVKTTPNAEGQHCHNLDFLRICWHGNNTQSVGDLWLGLLKFYSLTFSISQYVVCVRQLKVMNKGEKKWSGKKLAVEDPFSRKRNVTRSVSSNLVFDYIYDCIRKAYKYFGSVNNNNNSNLVAKVTPPTENSTKDKENIDSPATTAPIVKLFSLNKVNNVDNTNTSNNVDEISSGTDLEISPTNDNGSPLISRKEMAENDNSMLKNFAENLSNNIIDNVKSSVHQHNRALQSSELEKVPCDSENGDLENAESELTESESSLNAGHSSISSGLNETEMPNKPSEISSERLGRDCLEAFALTIVESVIKNALNQVLEVSRSPENNSPNNSTCDKESIEGINTEEERTPEIKQDLELSETRTPEIKPDLELSETRTPDIKPDLELSETRTPEKKPDLELSETRTPEINQDLELSETRTAEIKQDLELSETPNNDAKIGLRFSFSAENLIDGKGPAIVCSICQLEGHLKQSCPEETLPELLPLPKITPEHVNILNEFLKLVPRDFAPSSHEVNDRNRIVSDLEMFIRDEYPAARLSLFGSSCNGFGFRHSDLDICMTFINQPTAEGLDCVAIIEKLANMLKKHRSFYNILPITTAKVPILKFRHRPSNLEGDISLYNTLAQHNTEMLQMYSLIDKRVEILGYAMKVFAKVCEIGDASRGSLSSYGYVLMVLHYLQQTKPAVIPVLQELHPAGENPEVLVDTWNAWFFRDTRKLSEVWSDYGKNTAHVAQLWMGMFRYYTEVFDFNEQVVCIRQLAPLSRFEKLWNGRCIAIEDPFDLSHNLGAGLSRKMNMYIQKAFIHGRELYCTPVISMPVQYETWGVVGESFLMLHSELSGIRKLIHGCVLFFDLSLSCLMFDVAGDNKCDFFHPVVWWDAIQDFFFDVEKLTEEAPPTDKCCRACGKIGHFVKECPIVRNRKQREEDERRRRRDSDRSQGDDRNFGGRRDVRTPQQYENTNNSRGRREDVRIQSQEFHRRQPQMSQNPQNSSQTMWRGQGSPHVGQHLMRSPVSSQQFQGMRFQDNSHSHHNAHQQSRDARGNRNPNWQQNPHGNQGQAQQFNLYNQSQSGVQQQNQQYWMQRLRNQTEAQMYKNQTQSGDQMYQQQPANQHRGQAQSRQYVHPNERYDPRYVRKL